MRSAEVHATAAPAADAREALRPKIFAATFVSEIAVGAHVGGVGALIVLLAKAFDTSINTFTILSSFLGVGLVLFSLLSPWVMRATAGLVLKAASVMVVLGAIGLAFAPWIPLVIASGLLVGSGTSLVILIVPSVLAGPAGPAILPWRMVLLRPHQLQLPAVWLLRFPPRH